MSEAQEKLRAGMRAIWIGSLPRTRAQLDVLEQAAQAVCDGTLDDTMRRNAEREAHRLAGSTGSFGFKDASPIAREIESMFAADGELDGTRALQAVAALRKIIDTEIIPAPESRTGT
jgi:HPt (histidine-containing phosphotransfer) domain-containing protein